MITNEGKARQVETYHTLTNRRAAFRDKVEKAKLFDEFFNNVEYNDTQFTSWIWNVMAYFVEMLMYIGVFIYLFTLKTAFVGLTPAFAIVVLVWSFTRVTHYHIKMRSLSKQYRRHHMINRTII